MLFLAEGNASQGGGGYTFMIMIVAVVAAMWFMTRRTRKQQANAAQFRESLEIGQEVMTSSGLFGVVAAIDGDRLTLESPGGARTQWLRAAIARVVEPETYESEIGGPTPDPFSDGDKTD